MNISAILLRVSVSLLMIGLVLGIVMGIRQDFSLAPAHAHLNLIGFVLMFVVGLYYRLVPVAAEGMLARVQATLHIAGAIVLPCGIALLLGVSPKYEVVAIVGAFIVLAAMALFAVIVFRTTGEARASLGLPQQA